jgi:phosphotransferase system  glucose/maltose/N-acetylglucosamine-specific IIC component
MSIEFHQEVNQSIILKGYNTITKIAKFIPHFKWTAGILFAIGFLETIFLGNPDRVTMWANIIIWTIGLLFAFIGAVFHFLTGVKLRNMSRKYNLDQKKVQEIVDEILNKK